VEEGLNLLTLIKYLEDACLIYRDGERVVNSLNDVVCELRDFINRDYDNNTVLGVKERRITWKFLQETFFQKNGEKFSEIACRQAISMAYTGSNNKTKKLKTGIKRT
jgi:hypothetical protein